MNDHKLNFATFFSGIGAPEQALKNLQIPHNVVFACDIDKNAQKTYLSNHSCQYFYEDIKDIPTKKFKGNIDLLIFGAPCQSFSIAGHRRGECDERGQLFYKAIEIVNGILPKYFIAENVIGLLTHKETFKKLLRKMRRHYVVSYSVLNSLNFGVPQQRRRVYIIGIRRDINQSFSFPENKVIM